MRRRVLLVIKGLGRGGAEQLLVSAAVHGDQSRFDYQVAYVLRHKSALVDNLESAGVHVTCLSDAPGAGWPGALRRLVQDQGIELVHAHSPLPAVASRLVVPRSVPVLYTEHNLWSRYDPLTRRANAWTYGLNRHVFAVSDEVRRSVRPPRWLVGGMPSVETLYHGPEPDLARHIVANGVRAEFGISDGACIVGTIANLKHHKGYPILLKAAALVRAEVPDVRFLLVGTGPLEGELRETIRDLDLERTVTMTGFREDATRLAASFDVFALASLQEGLSIALLEAMALGRPPVVTRVGGLPEVVRDGVDGVLVDPDDADALAHQLVRLLRDAGLRRQLGEAARQRATAFDIRSAVRRMESVYEEVLT